MARGPLYEQGYSPQFSGHETFPLRYGWLKKAFDRVLETEDQAENRSACWGEDAIARFGVGKNMVSSMRYWAKASGVIDEPSANSVHTTELGRLLFGDHGLDPYMEHPATLWVVHWQLSSAPDKTTWFWAFNHFSALTFEREALTSRLARLAAEREWERASAATIKNDVGCFIRTYVARHPSGKTGHEDALESPLTELGLIKAVGKRDGFRFVRGAKTTLGQGVFAYALEDFWSRYSPSSTTLSLEAVTHAPGSPGRVFQFDETDVADRLAMLNEATSGAFSWSETAGLKQVVRRSEISPSAAIGYLQCDYRDGTE